MQREIPHVERWTITEPHADRFRLHINFGGNGAWCMFDYAVAPAPGQDGIEVVLGADADANTTTWFPALQRGMEAGSRLLRDHYGRLLSAVRVEVRKVHTHPAHTTAQGCERYGSMFIEQLGRRLAVRAT